MTESKDAFKRFDGQIKREARDLQTEFERWAGVSFILETTPVIQPYGFSDRILVTYAPEFSRVNRLGREEDIKTRLITLPSYLVGELPFHRERKAQSVVQNNHYCSQNALRNTALRLALLIERFEKNPIECDLQSDEGPIAIFGIDYFHRLRDEQGAALSPPYLITYRTKDTKSQHLLERLLS